MGIGSERDWKVTCAGVVLGEVEVVVLLGPILFLVAIPLLHWLLCLVWFDDLSLVTPLLISSLLETLPGSLLTSWVPLCSVDEAVFVD